SSSTYLFPNMSILSHLSVLLLSHEQEDLAHWPVPGPRSWPVKALQPLAVHAGRRISIASLPRCSRGGPGAPPLGGGTGTAGLDVRVVQVERGPLGPDPRDPGEVVPRRRAGGRPLQRVAIPPRVILGDLLPVLPRLVDVVEEDERGRAQDPGADAGDLVQRGHVTRQERVVRDPPWHALDTDPVLHQERHVEPDEHQPEMPFAQRVVQHLPGPLG